MVAAPARTSNARLVVIAAVAAAILVIVGAVGLGVVLAIVNGAHQRAAAATPKPLPGAPARSLITPSTPISAETGTVVFTDDFHDSQSGWDIVSGSSDVDYAFAGGAYVAVAKAGFYYFEPSPYSEPKQQLSVRATATLDVHTPPDAGFGADCVRGSGSTQVRYEFTAAADASWYVQRVEGPDSDMNVPTTLKHGSLGSAPAPGVIPVTLVAVCATMADGLTTRLALFVDGAKVADLTDTVQASSHEGWLADLITAGSDSRPVALTVTRFDERDLSRSGP
jgi:hypothetical protein